MKNQTIDGSPEKGVWKRFLLLIPVTIVLTIATCVHVWSVVDTYTASGNINFTEEEFKASEVSLSQEGIVEVVQVQRGRWGAPLVTFHALTDGDVTAQFGTGEKEVIWDLRVERGGILEGGVNFSGWEAIHVSLCVFLAATAVLFASALIRLWRASWYGYMMVACGGGLLFTLFQLWLFLLFIMRHSLRGFADLAFGLTGMADWFVYASLPAMAVLWLLVSISNVSLIRHEGFRPVNLLGIVVSVLWVIVNNFFYASSEMVFNMFSSLRIVQFVDSVLALAISFGECLLLSTMICAWLATRHVPNHSVDYLIVLGCGIRKDGTPSPLLAGRVDKALEFDRARISHGDTPATFVPSGGQGPDEVTSEAQSMSNYLQKKGVDAGRIVLENRSATTRENMAFSRKVIEGHAGRDVRDLSIAFSTTNYHVFRGYVCAHQAGMVAEGMGSKTKAYFWPNAFLREFVGLFVNQWKSILQTYVIIALIYVLAEYSLTLV